MLELMRRPQDHYRRALDRPPLCAHINEQFSPSPLLAALRPFKAAAIGLTLTSIVRKIDARRSVLSRSRLFLSQLPAGARPVLARPPESA
jgi:hypothetical protein